MKAFTTGQVDEVWLAYNKFVSVIRQDITLEQLLPIEPPTADENVEDAGTDYLYEPNAEGLLAELLPRYVETKVQRVLYDSAAAEQAARMTSMGAATKNAGEMIDALTMLYNRTRQAAITKELIEIVSGAQALGD
jgi:F-type H+-transporting ATPase subunit gamma